MSQTMHNDLRSKTVKAISHVGLGNAVGKLVSLSTTLVLARLLSPAEYGLMEIAMMLIAFIGFFNEIGLTTAIVQRPQLSQEQVNGCFLIAMGCSVVLFLLTLLAAGPLAGFFRQPQLQPMISTLAVGFIMGAAGSVPEAFLRKQMQFKAMAGITILGIVLQSAVSLGLALAGMGVWSLVWGSLVATATYSGGYFLLSPWRPRGRYGVREAVELVLFGLHVITSRVFWYLYSNADRAIVGRLLGAASLGIYGMAFSLATLPSSQITALVINVAAPLFAKLQHEPARLNAVLVNMTRGIAYVVYPALMGMLACSHELILVVLGPQWEQCQVPFSALCLMGLVKSVDPLLSQVLTAIGQVKRLVAYTALCAVTMSLAFAVGAWADGLRGVSAAWVLVYPLLSVKLLHDVARLTGLSMRGYYRALLPILAGALAMLAVVLGVRAGLYALALPVPLILVLEILSGALAYLAWIVYVDRHAVGEIGQILVDLGVPAARLQRWPFVRKGQP
ncbi:lipopolysaccharide biosynthesis protein [Herbaspirillum seropedicae]|uniref:lipopolysaccharide biosynthesis protein n=1 Tax=Herbaspirillum seropedicae TaxID=964 RepID=UPI00286696F3|nr:lipopolysaccharide biosynthesis protein [Herbaspirillum seropedicae]MDR6393860.1 O-antigen/teichoic acid export membrane protein [Herbaspirillum seropedicae]